MIRTAIREEQEQYRHRNVAKLLFMHMLGELCNDGGTRHRAVDGTDGLDWRGVGGYWRDGRIMGPHLSGQNDQKSVGRVCRSVPDLYVSEGTGRKEKAPAAIHCIHAKVHLEWMENGREEGPTLPPPRDHHYRPET
jgi:hypothetical protein